MKFILITGAAKRIGAEIVKYLVQKNYHIILHYNHSESQAKDLQKSFSKNIILCKADLSTKDGIYQLISFCDQYEIHTVIHNASMFENDCIFSENLLNSLEKHLNVNFFTRIEILQKLVQKSHHLNIIHILDYGIFKNPNNFFSYHFSNKILHSFTQMTARQLAPKVLVNSIALGYTLKNDRQSQQHFENGIKSTLLSRSSTINDLLIVIELLLKVHCMTGQTICLDGGMSIFNEYI